MLKVTLKRSVIKSSKAQKDTVLGLGLKKINQSRVLQDTPEIRGMVNKVLHLVAWEEAPE
jgi:large subunit ribosomal protein L30